METLKLIIGEIVLYSTTGICKVVDVVTRTFNREDKEYYVLAPVYDERSTCFVPVEYDSSKIHIERILTKEGAEELLRFAADASPKKWIANMNDRKQQYNEICRRGTREEKIRLIKTIYLHEQKQREQKKQLYACDERVLNSCKKQIYEELAYVLGKTVEEIAEAFVIS